jgi:hypothetical protein
VYNQDTASSLNIFPVHYALTTKKPTNQNINFGRRFKLVDFSFLDAFAKFVMSVRPLGTTRLPLNGFL